MEQPLEPHLQLHFNYTETNFYEEEFKITFGHSKKGEDMSSNRQKT